MSMLGGNYLIIMQGDTVLKMFANRNKAHRLPAVWDKDKIGWTFSTHGSIIVAFILLSFNSTNYRTSFYATLSIVLWLHTLYLGLPKCRIRGALPPVSHTGLVHLPDAVFNAVVGWICWYVRVALLGPFLFRYPVVLTAGGIPSRDNAHTWLHFSLALCDLFSPVRAEPK
jgi:hypothetical protein